MDKNPPAAIRAAQTLRDGAKLLRSFPALGKPMNDDTDRRELFLAFGAGAYVLRYRIDGNMAVILMAVILRVWHSREKRDPL